ncbi:MAG: AEC family transporter [Oceanospirillaceae bacterium]|nr:AEC family transporter [Oceanospirillaceae bacterium]
MLSLAKLIGFLEILTPLFMAIGVGFAATKYQLVPREGIRYLGLYVINIALPCMLFKALAERSIAEIFQRDYIAIYFFASLATLLIGIFFSFYIRRKNLAISTVMAMGSSFSNSAYIGYPIVFQLLGVTTIVPVALTLMVENAIMLPIALAIASSTSASSTVLRSIRQSILRVFKNPMIWGIITGICYSAFSLQAPGVILSVIDMFGNTSGPLALFAIGGSLVGLQINGMKLDITQIALGKLFIHPALMALFILASPDMPVVYQQSAILLACMPMMSIYPIIGAQYGISERCAAALLATTLLSFLSISFWSISLNVV